MRKNAPVVVVVALATFVLAGLWMPASADAKRFRAYVYPDRTRPEESIVVDDFRVNETVWDEGGVHYLWVRGPAGSFKVPLSDISQIEVLKCVGPTQVDWMRYDVKVTLTNVDVARYGTMDIRVLRGSSAGQDWYYYPVTQKDRGTRFWRIVVNPDRLPPTIPLEDAKPAEIPVPVVPAPAAPAPAPPSEDDLFARLSLEQLNAQNPLGDIFFDFDRDDVRPDGEATLQHNAAWMKRWATTAVQVEGYADPRGTQEYNADLGQRRANAARAYLVSLGIPGDRISMVSRGESEAFCSEATEACWARNRRAHFVITAK